jgi:hypothetical protein
MNFLLLLDPSTAAFHWLRGGGLGEVASQVAAALPLEGAQSRPDPLGRDMPVLSELIDAVTNRHEEVAVACRLLEASGGAAGWNSHIRESRNRAGCSREEMRLIEDDELFSLACLSSGRQAPRR